MEENIVQVQLSWAIADLNKQSRVTYEHINSIDLSLFLCKRAPARFRIANAETMTWDRSYRNKYLQRRFTLCLNSGLLIGCDSSHDFN